MHLRATKPSRPAVADLMTGHPIVAARSEKVGAAATRMRSCRIRHLPVTDGDKLVGLLSLREVLGAASEAMVGAVMSKPVTVPGSLAVDEAAARLLDEHVWCLLVVDGERLLGTFTATDALGWAGAALAEEGRQIGRVPGVEQVMTARPLVTISPDATLGDAWSTMQAQGIRHLPVVAGETVVGILSDRDVLAAGDCAANARVGNLMSRRISTIAAGAPAADAAEILLRRRVGALPVLRGSTLVGLVTVSDFLYWIVGRS